MKTELALGMALCVAAFQPAAAQSFGSNPTGAYIGGTLGAHLYDDDDGVNFDEGGSLGAQLGYRINDNLRAELEAEITGAEIADKGDSKLVIGRATLGLYYDLQSSDHGLVPYFGGGIGLAAGEIDAFDDDNEEEQVFDGEFTWHVEGGISLNLNPHVALVPSYRFTRTNNEDGTGVEDFTSHAIRIGLRASF